MLGIFMMSSVVLAAAQTVPAAPSVSGRSLLGPSLLEGRWRSERADVIVVDIVTCGAGYCGQAVLPSGCGETVLRLVPTHANGSIEFEGTMTVPADTHTYKATGMFDNDAAEGGPHIFVDGYDDLPTYEHREFPFGATFFRMGAAACRAVPVS